MALIQKELELKLKTRILSLESNLYRAFTSKSSGLYNAQYKIDKLLEKNPPKSGFNIKNYKETLWKYVSEEWGKVISKEIINILANDISKIIAQEITSYIKGATIIVPPGQTSAPITIFGQPATIVIPSAPANIS